MRKKKWWKSIKSGEGKEKCGSRRRTRDRKLRDKAKYEGKYLAEMVIMKKTERCKCKYQKNYRRKIGMINERNKKEKMNEE